MRHEENSELVKYRFQKAIDTLEEVKVQVENKLWNTAINRLYYACFYAAGALLASIEVYSKTHAGTKQMFGLHFVKTGIIDEKLNQFYIKIFSMRQSGDYEDYCDYEEEDAAPLFAPAKDFINTIEQVLYKK